MWLPDQNAPAAEQPKPPQSPPRQRVSCAPASPAADSARPRDFPPARCPDAAEAACGAPDPCTSPVSPLGSRGAPPGEALGGTAEAACTNASGEQNSEVQFPTGSHRGPLLEGGLDAAVAARSCPFLELTPTLVPAVTTSRACPCLPCPVPCPCRASTAGTVSRPCHRAARPPCSRSSLRLSPCLLRLSARRVADLRLPLVSDCPPGVVASHSEPPALCLL